MAALMAAAPRAASSQVALAAPLMCGREAIDSRTALSWSPVAAAGKMRAVVGGAGGTSMCGGSDGQLGIGGGDGASKSLDRGKITERGAKIDCKEQSR
jgi:hypothetical protein